MEIIVHKYKCQNSTCRNLEKRTGMRKEQITCPQCGKKMQRYASEKEKY